VIDRISVSHGKCNKRKQNVQNICYSQNTRCFTLCSKNRVYEIHLVEKINTLCSSWSELFLKKIFKLTYSYFLAYFTFFDYFLKSLQLYRRIILLEKSIFFIQKKSLGSVFITLILCLYVRANLSSRIFIVHVDTR